MITNSFLHLPGIGEGTERKLWEKGVRSWDDLESSLNEVFGKKKAETLRSSLLESREALEKKKLRYFSEKMKSAHAWRLVHSCSDAIAYLDIETTGLGFPPQSHTTTLAVLFKGEIFVEHEPSKKLELLERLHAEAKMIVTFNGLCFDIPFLRHETGLEFKMPHVDLRVWFRRQGLGGGLKAIQRAFPEVHQRSSMDIDGFDAVRLWKLHKKGMPRALEALMTYNAEDSLVLEPLLYLAYAKEKESHRHFKVADLPLAKPLPSLNTEVCAKVYRALRGGS